MEQVEVSIEQVEVMKGLLQVIPRHFICLKSYNFANVKTLGHNK
jgi:hypothetical protein